MLVYTALLAVLLTICLADNIECRGFCTSPNVRTVIFRTMDLNKKCWSREEIALLFTRRMMQELLPKRRPEAIPLLLDYFKECLLTVQKLATNKRTHTLLMWALADTLGGYLQAFGLPMTNDAFYEGTICYHVARQLDELQCALKKTLRTDGGGWTRPTRIRRRGSVPPLYLSQPPSHADHCQALLKKDELAHHLHNKQVDIVLPFVDDNHCPTAIAMPIKDKNLCGITSPSSANVLIRYYTKAVWCLVQTYGAVSVPENGKSEVRQVQNFFDSFYKWLTNNILPKIDDNNIYPAFGSVLRILDHLDSKVNAHSNHTRRHEVIKATSDEVFLETEPLSNLYKEIMTYHDLSTKGGESIFNHSNGHNEFPKNEKKCKMCLKAGTRVRCEYRLSKCGKCRWIIFKKKMCEIFEKLLDPLVLIIILLLCVIVSIKRRYDALSYEVNGPEPYHNELQMDFKCGEERQCLAPPDYCGFGRSKCGCCCRHPCYRRGNYCCKTHPMNDRRRSYKRGPCIIQ